MADHAALVRRFYEAFARKDGDAMAECYHARVTFSDPVFPRLEGAEAGGMWRMLCKRATDLEIVASGISADGATGRAHWEARYTFGATGRKVHNVIDATFRFEDGLIVEHRDVFDFWRWSRMAIGPAGVLLGWTPILRGAVRGQARKALGAFLAKGS